MGDLGGPPAGRSRLRGNIEELASGSLRVRVYAGIDVLTGRKLYLKEVVAAGPAGWRRAEAVRDELVRQVEQGRSPRTNASLRQLIERHLQVCEVEPRTRSGLVGYVRKHVAPLIGDQPIGAVNAEVLDTFYAQLRRCRDHCDGQPVWHRVADEHLCDRRCRPHVCKPLAAWTVRKIHYLISAAYESAIRWDWISVNPTVRARKPAPPAPDPQPPTAAEAAALLTECWRWGLGPFVWLAMTTGARRGELCALRWRNLQVRHADLAAHDCVSAACQWWLVIRRAIGQSTGQLWETDTKTHQRRHVALDLQTVAVLTEHRRRCEQDAAQLGVTLSDEHFMFAAGPDGVEPAKPSSMSQRYARCAKRLGINTTLKSLRHYSATELITAGVDIRTVAGRLGHAGGGTTTLKVYAAWVAAADQHASAVLMNRMPHRTAVPEAAPTCQPPAFNPKLTHERIAAALHERWQAGGLAAGTVLKVKTLAAEHRVSIGTAHSVLGLLDQLGVVALRTGRPTVVLPPSPAAMTPPATAAAVAPVPANDRPSGSPRASEPSSVTSETHQSRAVTLTLELHHLGTRIRTMRALADPDDFETLHQLLLDAVRRVGGERDRVGEYELSVLVAGDDQPITTVVAA